MKMRFNKITLSFEDEEEKLFRKEYFFESIFQFRIAFILLTILYATFGLLDTLIIPEHAKSFHIIRYLIVTPTLSIVFLLSFTSIFRKVWQLLLLISFIIGGIGISIMTMLAPDNYSYYAGLMLVFSAGYFFIKLRFFLATIGGWTILIIYNIGAIFILQLPHTLLISNNFFFISINLIGMFAAYNIEHYARRNFFLNQKLESEKLHVQEININLEKKVEDRTKELLIAKEKAEENENKLKSIFNVAPSGIGVLINRTFIEVNAKVCEMTGYTAEELVGQNARILYPTKKEYEFVGKEKYKQIAKHCTGVVETCWKRKDGKVIDVLLSSTPLNFNDLSKGVTFTALDISERKKAEQEIIANKEKAEESDRLKSAFLANMSHEIRTPMNGILGFADLLKQPGLTGDEQQKYIEIIKKSGKRMLNIINDIVDISKVEAGLMKLDIKETNIIEQIEYTYNLFKLEAESKGIKFFVNNTFPNKEAFVNTDREKLYAILTNLVKNAIKYTERGSIELGFTQKNDFLEFYVKDTGIGIPKDRLEAIFERFVQADIADKMALQGAGLGLSITKAYIEMLNGKIWVESEEGIGSTFYFTLPYIATSINKNDDQLFSPLVKIAQNVKLKILITEDDEVSELLLSETIKLLSKETLKARTGIEAVEICQKNPDIDLVLMDIQMPNLNGYDATRQIREFNKDIIIIAQTAYGLSGDRERAIEAGCNDYIAKPINKNKLQELIQKYFVKK